VFTLSHSVLLKVIDVSCLTGQMLLWVLFLNLPMHSFLLPEKELVCLKGKKKAAK